MNEDFKLKLLDYAGGIIGRGYTIENNGEYDKVDKTKMPYTPETLKQVYDKLLELFKDF